MFKKLAVIVGATALTLGFNASAHAEDIEQGDQVYQANVAELLEESGTALAAQINWKPYGDVLTVRDKLADGHSAVGQVWDNERSGSTYTVWNPNGAGTEVSQGFASAIDENIHVLVRVCTGEYGTKQILRCTEWISVSTS